MSNHEAFEVLVPMAALGLSAVYAYVPEVQFLGPLIMLHGVFFIGLAFLLSLLFMHEKFQTQRVGLIFYLASGIVGPLIVESLSGDLLLAVGFAALPAFVASLSREQA